MDAVDLLGLLPFVLVLAALLYIAHRASKSYYAKYGAYLDEVKDINREMLDTNRRLAEALDRNTAIMEDVRRVLAERVPQDRLSG